MTIARDRWQQHLKTRGDYYLDLGARAGGPARHAPEVGADVAALALECLAGVLEACRVGRLTRNQHVLLRLGELVALRRGSRRAGPPRRGGRGRHLPEKADRRFGPTRWPRSAGSSPARPRSRSAEEGVRWVAGAADPGLPGPAGRRPPPRPRPRGPGRAARRHGRGCADALYDRTSPRPQLGLAMNEHTDSPVAVVGLAAIMPDAPDATAFWQNLRDGRYSISDVPARALGPRAVLRPRPGRAGQDLQPHRRLGPRVPLGAAGRGGCRSRRRSPRSSTSASSGPCRPPGRPCSMPAGRSGEWTRSGSR